MTTANEDPTSGHEQRDWTVDPESGHSNASPEFLQLVDVVDDLIRTSASSLINGNSRSVASLIMAQLAHAHGLRPAQQPPLVTPVVRDWAWAMARNWLHTQAMAWPTWSKERQRRELNTGISQAQSWMALILSSTVEGAFKLAASMQQEPETEAPTN